MTPALLFYNAVAYAEFRYSFYKTIYDQIKNGTSLLSFSGRGIWENKYYEKRLILNEYDYKIYSGVLRLALKTNTYIFSLPYAIHLFSSFVSYETCVVINDLFNEDKYIVYSLVSDIGNYKNIIAYEVAHYILRTASNPEQVLALSLLSFPVYRNSLDVDLSPIFQYNTQTILKIIREREDIGSIMKTALAILNQAGVSALEWDDLLTYYKKNQKSTSLLEVTKGLQNIMNKVNSGIIEEPYITNINYRGSSQFWYLIDVKSGLIEERRFAWKFNGKSLDYQLATQTNYIPKYIINLRPYKERLTVGDKNSTKKLVAKAVNCPNRRDLERIYTKLRSDVKGKQVKKKIYRILSNEDINIDLNEIMKFSEVQLNYNYLQRRGSMSVTVME